jgi:hypothetical protein
LLLNPAQILLRKSDLRKVGWRDENVATLPGPREKYPMKQPMAHGNVTKSRAHCRKKKLTLNCAVSYKHPVEKLRKM